MPALFADVILPFALDKNYTYLVPGELAPGLYPGARVEVEFRNKVYTGVIARLHDRKPQGYAVKSVLSLPDHVHVVHPLQLQFWEWMAQYYMCSMGEVMQAALPAPYKLSSETIVLYAAQDEPDPAVLDDKEFLVAEALSIQKELNLKDIQQILQQRTIQPVVKSLIEKGYAAIKEELKETYTVKKETYIYLQSAFQDEKALRALFDALESHPAQLDILMMYYQLTALRSGVKRSVLLRKSGASPSVLKTMIKKDIFRAVEEEVSRLGHELISGDDTYILNEQQEEALQKIHALFEEKQVVLLHGVTGSGKTEVYIELIREAVEQGKQVLYLLPEIALTAQIITRLKKRFGSQVGVYHSKFNQNERVEIWQKVLRSEYKIILGARSALLLPFSDPGLIIVDEEHDYSYKQMDPAPRYHARDAAIYLAHIHGAKVLLGTATPAVESYFHAQQGKYGLVEMFKRFADMEMPELQIVDMRAAEKEKNVEAHLSGVLRGKMNEALRSKEQIILFQNRRGYAPYLYCANCGWSPTCIHCDVHLVYHKYADELRCHYCNYKSKTYSACPACGSSRIMIRGFGTEKMEDELEHLFPDTRIARLDLDAVRTKHGHEKVIRGFEDGEIDILVGTQMVTKGLDFDNVNLVGILSADQLLHFSEYRAAERAYQMIMQVSGRAGRKHKKGLVLIQALQTQHPVLLSIMQQDMRGFYAREIAERRSFLYPPFVRLIRVTLKHPDSDVVQNAAFDLAQALRTAYGEAVLGPAAPSVGRIRNKYLQEILLKCPNNNAMLGNMKSSIKLEMENIWKKQLYKRVEMVPDVDPM
ncbi:MAG: primosomal protein N' [Chitinophagales bacterium]